MHKEVAGLIFDQGTYLGHRFSPSWGVCMRGSQLMFLFMFVKPIPGYITDR